MKIKLIVRSIAIAVPAMLATATASSAEPELSDLQLGLDNNLEIIDEKADNDQDNKRNSKTLIVNEEKALEWLQIKDTFPSYPNDHQTPWWGG